MSLDVRVRLWIMMFLQYFIWGAWYVTMGAYLLSQDAAGLAFGLPEVGRAYNAAPLAAIVSPFIVGMIADRFFSTQRILAVLHLAGAGIMYYLSTVGQGEDFGWFWTVLFAYTVFYMPTLALTNSLSFHHMTDPAKEFPGIRVLGTLGWIASSGLVGVLLITDGGFALDLPGIAAEGTNAEPTHWPMVLAAYSSGIMGLFCFFLPHTPPSGKGKSVSVRDLLGLDALALMKEPPFLIFVIGSFLICWPLQFYYAGANGFLNAMGVEGWEAVPTFENAATKQTLGQWSEVIFMLAMPFMFRRLGVKRMLLVGMLAWVVRYFLFAYGDTTSSKIWMLYVGILVHGICYDFFFVTGQIYVDKKAPAHIRASAQGFITLVTLGLGLFVGSEIFAQLGTHVADRPVPDQWYTMWIVPGIFAAVVMVVFAFLFRPKDDMTGAESGTAASEDV